MCRALFDRDTAPGAEPEDLMRLDIPALVVPGHDASHATPAARYLEECLPRSGSAAERRGWDAGIRRIGAEMPRPAGGAAPRHEPVDDADGDIADLSASAPERGPLQTPFRLSGVSLLAVAIVAAAIGAGGFMFWGQPAPQTSPAPSKKVASAPPPPTPAPAQGGTPNHATAKDSGTRPDPDRRPAD